jgi:hypothetical protein
MIVKFVLSRLIFLHAKLLIVIQRIFIIAVALMSGKKEIILVRCVEQLLKIHGVKISHHFA